MIRKLILAIAAVLLVSSAPASATESGTVRLRTQQILKFEQLAGQPGWRTSAYNRVANASWVFYSNGTCAFTTTTVQTDLYPLYGKYQVNGNTVAFSAHNSAAIGGSSAFTATSGSARRPPRTTR